MGSIRRKRTWIEWPGPLEKSCRSRRDSSSCGERREDAETLSRCFRLTNVKKCTDKAAYTKEVENKILLYGIAVLICGGFGVLETQTGLLGKWYLVVIAVFLAVTFWFAMVVKKSGEKYWPQTTKKMKK